MKWSRADLIEISSGDGDKQRECRSERNFFKVGINVTIKKKEMGKHDEVFTIGWEGGKNLATLD